MTAAITSTADLAARINREHEACSRAVGAALTHAMNAGERHEVPFTEPQNYNEWMFDSHEHYLQRQVADWKRQAEEAA